MHESMTDPTNNLRNRPSSDEISEGMSSSFVSVVGNRSLRGRKCWCGSRTVLLTCKKGVNKGRRFWRCPYWM